MIATKRKGGKAVEVRPLQLKVRKNLWLAWKIQAAKENTTMSEIAERVVGAYLKKKGGDVQ
jgi:hypothetical protein